MTVLVVVAAAALTGLAGEIAARWWIRRRNRYYVLPPGLRLQLFPDREVFPQLERETRFEVNSDGERGGEVPRPRAGLYRVLVGGGSQPEGFLLDQDTAWPGALSGCSNGPAHLRALGAASRARRQHRPLGRRVGGARSDLQSRAASLSAPAADRHPDWRHRRDAVAGAGRAAVDAAGASGRRLPLPSRGTVRLEAAGRSRSWSSLLRARRRWLPAGRSCTSAPAGGLPTRARCARARRTISTAMPDAVAHARSLRAPFPPACSRWRRAHADRVLVVRQPWFDKAYTPEEAAHMWHGGAGQVWREEVTTYYSFDVVSRLMALVDAQGGRDRRGRSTSSRST